jgi:hypothetical protein
MTEITFFIVNNDGGIDYFNYSGSGDKYAALKEYISEHYTISEIALCDVYEGKKLKLEIKIGE